MKVSLLIPVFNEEENVQRLYDEIVAMSLGRPFEVELVFVDDGSTDRSHACLLAIAAADPRVRVVRFRRNFGQTAGLAAAIDHATGDVLIPMDADLQNDPADVPRLLEKLDEGYDVVSGWRRDRKDTFLSRRLPSVIANRLISRWAGVPLHDYGCSLKAYRADVIKEVRLYGEMHRFVPIYASWAGARVTELVVNHRARQFGVSKYGINRTFKVLLDMLTVKFLGDYSTKPIYMFGAAGGALLALACTLVAVAVVDKLTADHIGQHIMSLLLLSTFLGTVAIVLVMMGLLAEIIVRTYHESQNKPIYLVRDITRPATSAVCGITGWLTPDSSPPPDPGVVARMADAIAHRGPDGSGLATYRHAALGHRRLSIVDLTGGAQPMRTLDGDLAVTFNGEIFNHTELRRHLERRGHKYTSNSDTEALLHGFREWGAGMTPRLNGMFAFCVWDERERVALLARDRLGQKPLFYARLGDGGLVFASELKAMLQHPAIAAKLDPTALALYLTYEYVPAPRSAIAGVHKLPAGAQLQWRNGEVVIEPYVQLPFGEPTPARTEREWIAETRAALHRGVERRLMADVPLGVFLSGGVDSSAVVGAMSKVVPPAEIQTFSIAFEDPSFDESAYARTVAAHFGTHHRVRTFSEDELVGVLPRVVEKLDEPFGDASLLPTTLLCEFTREHVTVAIGGDGGDELFCGYETFRADTGARLWKQTPAPARRLAAAAIERLPVDTANFSLDFVLKSFIRGADADGARRHVQWLSSFLPGTPDDPLAPALRRSVPDELIYGVMQAPYDECRDPRHLQRLSFAYIRSYLADDILAKVDRASMATSLEVRSPFMDPELLSLVARMPPELKLRHGFEAKYALKRAVEHDLPAEIVRRKKKGFGMPVARWLNGPLAPEADRLLDVSRLQRSGVLRSDVVARLLREHRDGMRDNRKQLWTLMMLEAWMERYDVNL